MHGTEHYDITLVEKGFEFKNDWTLGQTLIKEIYVTYPHDADDSWNKGPMYARVALKELLQIQPPEYRYYEMAYEDENEPRPVRFMVDENGEFIHGQSIDNIRTTYTSDPVVVAWLADTNNEDNFIQPFGPGSGASNSGYLFGPDDGSWNDDYFVMTTAYGAYGPNGQCGKYLVVEQTTGTAAPNYRPPVQEDDPLAARLATVDPLLPLYEDDDEHPEHTDIECGLPFYVWPTEPDDSPEFSLNNPDIRAYIKWNYEMSNFIFIDDIETSTAIDTGVWIIDTDSNYAYWSKALNPGDTTSNLLDSVTLLHKPEGEFWNTIHADLEAVSFDQLGEWDYDYDDDDAADYPAPDEIRALYTAAFEAAYEAAVEENSEPDDGEPTEPEV
jgi:hypothetical protein